MRKGLIPRGRLTGMSVFDEFDHIFEDIFGQIASANQQNSYPVCNIYVNSDDNLIFEFALAGFSKDEIDVVIEDNILTVSAEKQTSEDSENKYIIRRFSKRSFNKKYDLDGIWDTNSVEADFSDGVLTLSFTKKEEEQTTVKRVEI